MIRFAVCVCVCVQVATATATAAAAADSCAWPRGGTQPLGQLCGRLLSSTICALRPCYDASLAVERVYRMAGMFHIAYNIEYLKVFIL